jgi:hypothetical protein
MAKYVRRKKKSRRRGRNGNGSGRRRNQNGKTSQSKKWKPPTGKELKQLQEDWDHVT